MNWRKPGRPWVSPGSWLPGALLLIASLAGCAGVKQTAGGSGEVRTIWQTREQFVAIGPQEQDAPSIKASQHPLTVSPAQLRRRLGSIRFIPSGTETPVPLFTEAELEILQNKISKGLAQAGPREDVTFVIFGYHPAILGLAKETKVTTGRIFYEEGKLNLILGAAQREVNDREDRRLFPFVPGSRLHPAKLAGRIVPEPGNQPFTLKRQDWLLFPFQPGEPEVAPITPGKAAPPLEEPAPARKEEKKEKSLGSIEERLQLLNDLKGKGLITDEEFREKRRQILNEL